MWLLVSPLGYPLVALFVLIGAEPWLREKYAGATGSTRGWTAFVTLSMLAIAALFVSVITFRDLPHVSALGVWGQCALAYAIGAFIALFSLAFRR
ncbi:MAG: hypothetical protein AB7O98_19370 [Hyphomonadaceae bacterium]